MELGRYSDKFCFQYILCSREAHDPIAFPWLWWIQREKNVMACLMGITLFVWLVFFGLEGAMNGC